MRYILLLIAALLLIAIYLNRSYARIFEYNNSQGLLNMNHQQSYILDQGNGTQTLKYAALGDSLTYGLGAKSDQGTFPYVLSQRLLDKYTEVEVINLAVSGAVAEDVLKYQLPQALEQKPDLVTIMIGTNDIHNYVDRESFKKELESIIDQLKEKLSAKIVLINIPYLGTKNLILPPHDRVLDFRIKEFNQIIKEIADSRQVKYFDLYSVSKEPFEKNPEKYYSADEFHPSDEGYILWGNLINAD